MIKEPARPWWVALVIHWTKLPDITRSFYVIVEGPVMVLLHAYKKQSRKAPRHEVDLALRRMKEVLG